jgi:hypothetical protein
MKIFLISLAVFGAVIVGMAVGVIFGKRRLKGSCGGLSAWRGEDGEPLCDACADCPEKRRECEFVDAAGAENPMDTTKRVSGRPGTPVAKT